MRGLSRINRCLAKIRLWPPRGYVRWGSLRRTTPISRVFGLDRGQAIDRYYIEKFLTAHSPQIRGVVLEIGDDSYTRCFGGSQVTRSEVLHVIAGNPKATLIGNLQTGQGVPSEAFDCIILTQTLQLIYDVQAAITNAYAALKPNAVLLATVPGISHISRYDMDCWGDYWRFTDASARQLFGDVFGAENVAVKTHGNVLVACAFLHGLAVEELKPAELGYSDPDYQVIITVRAMKGEKTV